MPCNTVFLAVCGLSRAYGRATHAKAHGSSVLGLLSMSNAMQCDTGVSVGMMQRCTTALTGV